MTNIPDSRRRSAFHTMLPFAALSLIWAVELFVVQETTLFPNYPFPAGQWMARRGIRLMIDLLGCALLVFLLPRLIVFLLQLWSLLSSLALIEYFDYFGSALSLRTALHSTGEGLGVAGYFLERLVGMPLLILITLFFVKLMLLRRMPPRFRDQPFRIKIGAVILALYLLTVFTTAAYFDPLRRLGTWGSVGRLGLTYGYIVTWVGEGWYLNEDRLVARALSAARERQDRHARLEANIPLSDQIAILQVESLDFDLIDFFSGGMEVTPFLNQLKKASLFYKLRAIYVRGSADADFTLLTGRMPSPDVVTYQLKTYPYGHECLPHLASAGGYDVVSLHGNTGTFFNRREAFGKMGFHTCYFLEELLEAGLPRGRWGIEDARVLKFSGDLFSNTDRPALHFIITLTSHGPFTYLADENETLFRPPSTLEERYLNSMNYVDRAMDEYVKMLPDRTLCIIYGDHNAHFDFSGRKRPGQPDYVPCLIYRKGEDLSGLLKKEDRKNALSGAMDFIDLNAYLTRLLLESETVTRRPAPHRDN